MGQKFESVWEALSDTPEEANNMKLRSALLIQITEAVKSRKLTPKQIRDVLGLTQPRVSYLMTGRIDKFSLDMLVSIASRAGLRVTLDVAGQIAA